MTDPRELGRVTLKYDVEKARAISDMRLALQRLEKEFSRDAVEQTGLAVGEVLRNPHTGATYRVESVSVYGGWPVGDRPRAVVRGRRVYATGRRDASQPSHLDLSELRRTTND